MRRNPCFSELETHYLFPEIGRRKREFQEKNPNAKLINLGIGDTTEPLPQTVTHAIAEKAKALGTKQGYAGYGPEQGEQLLREKLSHKLYGSKIKKEEIFVSDGAKCDIGRLQLLFGNEITIAVQDPAYPVYVEGSKLLGVKKIIRMACTPENNFFPELVKADLLYFSSPNNPTGAILTRKQLQTLVDFALNNKSLILFDTAYAHYIQDPSYPRSIYEIEGARRCAIEIGSFSKLAGFSGVRLGWTVVPEELLYEDGGPIRNDWNRVVTTIFNGASNLSQAGGIAVCDHFSEIQAIISFYLENARILKKALSRYSVYGGEHSPYLWVGMGGKKSWDLFQDFLENRHIVTTPGSGFGPTGEGFLRFSAFGSRDSILEAAERLAR